MKLILDDNGRNLNFAPLSLTRPVGELRVGIFTNAERWSLLLPEAEISYKTQDYLQDKYPMDINGVTVNACLIPDESVVEAVKNIKPNQTIRFDGGWIAKMGMGEVYVDYSGEKPLELKERWELYQLNDKILAADFKLITNGRQRDRKSVV